MSGSILIMVGLLAIPNMIALLLLSKHVSDWTKTYFGDLNTGKIKPTIAKEE